VRHAVPRDRRKSTHSARLSSPKSRVEGSGLILSGAFNPGLKFAPSNVSRACWFRYERMGRPWGNSSGDGPLSVISTPPFSLRALKPMGCEPSNVDNHGYDPWHQAPPRRTVWGAKDPIHSFSRPSSRRARGLPPLGFHRRLFKAAYTECLRGGKSQLCATGEAPMTR
jgi:hypothetical protein